MTLDPVFSFAAGILAYCNCCERSDFRASRGGQALLCARDASPREPDFEALVRAVAVRVRSVVSRAGVRIYIRIAVVGIVAVAVTVARITVVAEINARAGTVPAATSVIGATAVVAASTCSVARGYPVGSATTRIAIAAVVASPTRVGLPPVIGAAARKLCAPPEKLRAPPEKERLPLKEPLRPPPLNPP